MKWWNRLVQRTDSVLWLVFLLAATGTYQLFRLPVSFLPEVPDFRLKVVYHHKANNPFSLQADAEKMIRALGSLAGEDPDYLIDQSSLSIDLVLASGMDVITIQPEIRARLEEVRPALENHWEVPVITPVKLTDIPSFKLLVHGEIPFSDISFITEKDLQPRLRQLKGVTLADVSGLIDQRLLIRLETSRVNHWSGQEELYDLLAKPYAQSTPLKVRAGSRVYGLEPDRGGMYFQPELNSRVKSGRHFATLGDLGFMGQQWIGNRGVHFYNGHRAVAVNIYTSAGHRLDDLREDLLKLIKYMQVRYRGIQITLVEDQALVMSESMSGLWWSLIVACTGVILLLLLFGNDWQLPGLIALTLPLSFLFTAGIMGMTGMSLNIISVSGLVLGMGILIDNGIVVIHGIVRFHQAGYPVIKACYLGICDMLSPLLGSNLTTMLIFVPLLIDDGVMSLVFSEEAKVLIINILVSLVISLLILPLLYLKLFSSCIPPVESYFSRIIRKYAGRIAGKVHSYPGISLLAFIAFTGIASGITTIIPLRYVPDQQDQHWEVHMSGDPGNLGWIPGRSAGHAELIKGRTGYLLGEKSPGNTVIFYGRGAKVAALKLADLYPSARMSRGQNPLTGLFNSSMPDVEVRYTGEAGQLAGFLADIGKIPTRYTMEEFIPHERIDLIGPLKTYPDFRNEKVEFRFTRQDSIVGKAGKRPLYAAELAQRYNAYYPMEVRGNLKGQTVTVSYTGDQYDREGKVHRDLARSLGLGTQKRGLEKQSEKLRADVIRIIAIASIILFIVLLIQYGSFIWPLIVMSVIPTGVAGSILALFICGFSINVMSGIGLIAMLGVVVNDAILKVSAFLSCYRRMPSEQALEKSNELRLQPILITTGTTVICCLPVLFLPGTGNEIQRSLAVALAGGVTSATAAALFLVPALIRLVLRRADTTSHRQNIRICK